MVKRLTTQPSFKISNKQPTHQFNSLIKVLKPKVFITTSSNFKTLVQELTGNDSRPSVPPSTMHVVSSEPTHVIHIDNHHDSHDTSIDHRLDPNLEYSLDRNLDYSPDPSLDPSLDSLFMSFDYSNGLSDQDLGLQFSEKDQVIDYVNHESELRNIESWLLDIGPSAWTRDESYMPLIDTYNYDYN
ncbi:hypothetical protein E3N88_37906 [Mikania micrantha]|uniref:VQ domain-containing protein n=1 Tax=Mikania micrantha TaxID=192012 RepID=A0A5N6LSK9_9ASTR|nr:hypothetical protein E3N88_37906 [Mikania micrantha]